MKRKLTCIFLLILLFPVHIALASKLTLNEQRKEFLLAEKLVKKGKTRLFFKKLEVLTDYPLYPYLQYQWLNKNLNQSKRIKKFLSYYADTRYAGLLKYKWQIYLAKHKEWTEFINQYSHTNNTKIQCYYYLAKYKTGAKKEALAGARKLWVVGRSQPSECDAVFKAFKKSSAFTPEVMWQRFDAALVNNKVKLAKYIQRSMSKKDQQIAGRWLKVHASPLLIANRNFLNIKQRQSGMIFAHGVDRLARTDPVKAIEIWDARKLDYKINPARKDRLEQRLAMSLVFRRDKMAYSRLSQLNNPDESAQEWRVRAALREQNWTHVEQAINALDKEIKEQEKWKYWLARSLEKTDKARVSDSIYSKLSKDRSFYGYLSADKLKKSYRLADHPVQVTDEMLTKFMQKTDFRVVAELIEINKELEAKRQWWYAVGKLDKSEILIAAKYAQKLNWKQVAIFTVAKAEHWDDVSLRFPILYEKQVQKNADRQNLNPAIIFGLIRRESVFDENARSPVGARGLMQIMPKTGRQIARELNEKWRSTGVLLNPSTNVKYGSYYYKQLLNQFDGNYALAAAAYNAGPHRVNRWLPKTEALAADIWIETIPFKETRAYVSAVLTYALIYQKQLKKNVLTMKDFMRDVLPKKI
jgi:soluble lytic murein transglycosylase